MKNKEPRRHHYVPQWYQAGFADADGLLWVYDRKLHLYRKTHPKSICWEKDMYTIDPEGDRDQRIETEYMNQVDGEGATAVRILASGRLLDKDWTESFSIFMAFLITRSPAFRTMMSEMYRASGEEMMRLMTTDVDRAKRHINQYRKITGGPARGITPESVIEAVKGGHLKASATERPFLQHMFRQVEFLSRLIASFDWRVLISPPDGGFIISDHPFAVVPDRTRPDLVGLGLSGTAAYLPLTRWLCLKMGNLSDGFSDLQISKEEVRIVNQNIAVNSERFIIGPAERQLRHVISRSSTETVDPIPGTTLRIVQSDNDQSIFQTTFWPVRKFFYSKT
jgi:hypothetical protein